MSNELNGQVPNCGRGPIVIKIGGAALDAPAESNMLAGSIAALHQSWPSGIVVVHGGGTAVDQHLARLGLQSEKRDGIRITPQNQIDEVVAVLAGKVNKRFVGQLQAQGLSAVGLCLGDGFLVRSVKAANSLFDPGHVGRAVGGDPLLVQTLLPAGFVPVICSIGLDSAGQPLNVNADEAAADLARLLGASNLILLTDVAGVIDANGAIVSTLTIDEVEQLIDAGIISGGMVPKVRSAVAAVSEWHMPVTIASWREPMLTNGSSQPQWSGTCITPAGSPFKRAEYMTTNNSPGGSSHALH